MEQYNNIKKIKEMKNKVQPKTKKELIAIIDLAIKENGNKADLNFIDTSKITNMSNLFEYDTFDGDISGWDVSNVKDMSWMFSFSVFNQDISKWDISKVKDMSWMFYGSMFNQDISGWNISKVLYSSVMFDSSPLENKPEYQPTFQILEN